ncbi:UvrD-helicase domain-containing protein [Streptomyces sp. WI04-05B]|uniref:UvrD-helicase domain-containing protein n=1 Tax=Streptomyces TaxID=1883 RepID=UPI0029A091DA|nr:MULTISPECIES: UvrD-helicase domain-containing protein [unclassified Streptomyces]MDX2546917.1 UvrD-helicase domain-containing protein [Streptomyces sp. WI04-05B]MDX2589302.1 UvrD-helicase domain-containing protein [Streptomyces sp. WI04-05A]
MTTLYAPDAFIKDKVDALAQHLGLDLPHQEQWNFIQSAESLDLQAAPGSGKTSLIGLKLALLAKAWTSPTRGICVLSHTNTAKDEITHRLTTTPAGRSLLQYPHFIGTIQAFTNTFLALPALRARGVEVQTVDDRAYADEALRLFERHPKFRKLRTALGHRTNGPALVAGARYVCDAGQLIATGPDGTPPFKASSDSGQQFAALKEALTERGVFRYHDMFAIAEHHLFHHPQLALAAAHRFPFVLLDEMQDTSDLQQDLLGKVFGLPGAVVQRVGDVNQRIFADAPNAAQPSSFPLPHAAQLPVSRRFGSKIAALASDLTVHRRQRIDGAGHDGTVALLLFDDDTVAEVVPAFERMAAAAVPRQLLLGNPPRVLGARLTPRGAKAFPQSVSCYVPGFTTAPAEVTGSLITATRTAQALRRAGDNHAAVTLLWNAFRDMARIATSGGLPPLSRLERDAATAAGRARLLLHDLLTSPLDSHAEWAVHTARLLRLLQDLTQSPLKGVARLTEPLAHIPYVAQPAVVRESPADADHDVVPSVAGSIQSAKGETHAATLILECLERSGKKHDVHEVLGLLSRQQDASKALVTVQRAVQLVFVGATRPTHLLAFAAHRTRAEPYVEAMTARGWSVHDISLR